MIDHASEMAAFVRVVDSNGFSAAAPVLGLTPSAVSKLITRLEARLGVRLLQRTTRALHLTQEGEVFYAAAGASWARSRRWRTRSPAKAARRSGVLRVTTSLAFSTHQLAPVLSEFLARHPLVQVELLPTDRVIDMVEEGIDVAIRIGRLADTSFMARKIGEDKRLICAAPSYLARHGAPQRPEDLAGTIASCRATVPISIAGPSRSTARCVEIEVGGRVAVSEGEAQMQLALQGIGIVRLTRLTLAQAIRDGTLVPLLGDFSAEEAVAIHAVYPHRRHLAPKVPAFVEFPDREVHAAAVGDLKREI